MNGVVDSEKIEIEYINMEDNALAPGRHVAEFKHIFEHFTTPMNDKNQLKKEDEKSKNKEEELQKKEKVSEEDEAEEEKQVLSKKQRKLMKRMKVFDLKMKVRRPDLVEEWDITS